MTDSVPDFMGGEDLADVLQQGVRFHGRDIVAAHCKGADRGDLFRPGIQQRGGLSEVTFLAGTLSTRNQPLESFQFVNTCDAVAGDTRACSGSSLPPNQFRW